MKTRERERKESEVRINRGAESTTYLESIRRQKIDNPKKKIQFRARSGSVPSVRNFFEELPVTKNY